MILAKHCVSRGCRALACYGFGSLRGDTMRWACAAHNGLIGFADLRLPLTVSDQAEGVSDDASSAALVQQQGSIW